MSRKVASAPLSRARRPARNWRFSKSSCHFNCHLIRYGPHKSLKSLTSWRSSTAEQWFCKPQVGGSIPLASSIFHLHFNELRFSRKFIVTSLMTDLFHRKETNQQKITCPFPSHILSGIQDFIFQSKSKLAQVKKNTTAPQPSCRHSSNTRSDGEAQSAQRRNLGLPAL